VASADTQSFSDWRGTKYNYRSCSASYFHVDEEAPFVTIVYNRTRHPESHTLNFMLRNPNTKKDEIIKQIFYSVDEIPYRSVDMRKTFISGKGVFEGADFVNFISDLTQGGKTIPSKLHLLITTHKGEQYHDEISLDGFVQAYLFAFHCE
jgi:hypothetical protein